MKASKLIELLQAEVDLGNDVQVAVASTHTGKSFPVTGYWPEHMVEIKLACPGLHDHVDS